MKDPNRPKGPLISLEKERIPSLETVNLLMKNLATFHGMWTIFLKTEYPPKIGGLSKNEVLECLKHMKVSVRQMKSCFSILESVEKQMVLLKKSPEVIAAFRRFRKDGGLEKAFGHVHPDFSSKFLTICHGDCWTNNFFVDDERSKVNDNSISSYDV